MPGNVPVVNVIMSLDCAVFSLLSLSISLVSLIPEALHVSFSTTS